jgi:hypothetical protein
MLSEPKSTADFFRDVLHDLIEQRVKCGETGHSARTCTRRCSNRKMFPSEQRKGPAFALAFFLSGAWRRSRRVSRARPRGSAYARLQSASSALARSCFLRSRSIRLMLIEGGIRAERPSVTRAALVSGEMMIRQVFRVPGQSQDVDGVDFGCLIRDRCHVRRYRNDAGNNEPRQSQGNQNFPSHCALPIFCRGADRLRT